jgi:hypothetical protein
MLENLEGCSLGQTDSLIPLFFRLADAIKFYKGLFTPL